MLKTGCAVASHLPLLFLECQTFSHRKTQVLGQSPDFVMFCRERSSGSLLFSAQNTWDQLRTDPHQDELQTERYSCEILWVVSKTGTALYNTVVYMYIYIYIHMKMLHSWCLLFNFLFYCKSEMVQLKVDDDVRWKQGRHIIQQSISSVIQKQKIWLLLRHIYIFQY